MVERFLCLIMCLFSCCVVWGNLASMPCTEADSVVVEYDQFSSAGTLVIVYSRNNCVCYLDTLMRHGACSSGEISLSDVQREYMHKLTDMFFVSQSAPIFAKRIKQRHGPEGDYLHVEVKYYYGSKCSVKQYTIGNVYARSKTEIYNDVHQYTSLYKVYIQFLERIFSEHRGGVVFEIQKRWRENALQHDKFDVYDVSDHAIRQWLGRYRSLYK